MCVCPKYDSLREHLVSIVCNDNPNFGFLSVNDKFLNLMQALDSLRCPNLYSCPLSYTI